MKQPKRQLNHLFRVPRRVRGQAALLLQKTAGKYQATRERFAKLWGKKQ